MVVSYHCQEDGGNIDEECLYNDNEKDGLYQRWHCQKNGGKLAEQCAYKDDEKVGTHMTWNQYGYLIEVCMYNHDKKNGDQNKKYYDEVKK